jgi:ketosteroid isomerase-like protein
MADKQAITELLNKGGYAYDTGDVDFLTDMFTEDGRFELSITGVGPVGPFEGREAVRKLFADSLESQSDQRRHVVTNIFFEDETDDSITAYSYLVLITVKDGALDVISSGVYRDTVVRDGDAWRIKLRNLALDLPY